MNYLHNPSSLDNALSWCAKEQPKVESNGMIRSIIGEVSKGCTGQIYSHPLASIEPHFKMFQSKDVTLEKEVDDTIPESLEKLFPYTSASIVFHIQDTASFAVGSFELLKHLQSINGIFYFELVATKNKYQILFHFPTKHSRLFESAFKTCFPKSELILSKENVFSDSLFSTIDVSRLHVEWLCPNFPYHRNLYVSGPNKTSALYCLFQSLSVLEDGEWFCYRIAVENSSNKWDMNCVNLFTFENKALDFCAELNENGFYYIPPIAELKKSITEKTSPDSLPFYSVLPMMFFQGSKEKFQSIKSFTNQYRFGDKNYQSVSKKNILESMSELDLKNLLFNRTCHMQGHVLNRAETASFLTMPCELCANQFSDKLSILIGKSVPEEYQSSGIVLGKNEHGDTESLLCMPKDYLQHSLSIYGVQGFGKTNLLLNILAQIAGSTKPKYAMVVFYFHDFSFVVDFVSRIPVNRLDDVILAVPSLNGKILGKNIVASTSNKPAKKASNLSYAIESGSTSFGIDVRFVMKNLLNILMLCENASLSDIYKIANKENSVGKTMRAHAMQKTSDPMLIDFIRGLDEKGEDIRKIENKLQGFSNDEDLSLMSNYCGPDLISYKDVIENKKILIWFFGNYDEAGNTLASIEASLIHQHFASYGDVENKIKPYFPTVVAIDEAQRIKANGISKSIREDRKSGLSYIVSTQTKDGVDPDLIEGLDLIPSICCFQPTENDAKYFSLKTSGLISTKDVMALRKYQMYVRLMQSSDVYPCKSMLFEKGNLDNINRVIENCLRKYYIDPDKIKDVNSTIKTPLQKSDGKRRTVSPIAMPRKKTIN